MQPWVMSLLTEPSMHVTKLSKSAHCNLLLRSGKHGWEGMSSFTASWPWIDISQPKPESDYGSCLLQEYSFLVDTSPQRMHQAGAHLLLFWGLSCSVWGGHRERNAICPPAWPMAPTALACRQLGLAHWWCLNTCLLMGSSQQMFCFDLLIYKAFASLIKPPLSQPKSSLTFTLQIISLISPGGSEWVAAWCLAAGLG